MSDIATLDRVRSAIATLLPGAGDIGADRRLREVGLDSLALTRLWFTLHTEFAADITVEALRDCETAGDIADLVAAAPAATAETPVPSTTTDTFEPTELQRAYLLAKNPDLTDDPIGCHIYREFTVPDLDVARLESAWLRLVRTHPMLRARFDAEGNGHIAADLTDWSITVKGSPEQLRDKGFTADAWPLFAVAVDGDTVHLSIDATIVDGQSLNLLLRQWRAAYTDPTVELPTAGLSLTEALHRAGERNAADLAYWREQQLPPSPRTQDTAASNQRRTLSGQLDPSQWQSVRERAQAADVSPTALVLTVFAEALARHTASPDFTLLLTTSHRPRLPRSVDLLVAPLTDTVLLPYTGTADVPLDDAAQRVRSRLWESLDHNGVSATEAARAAGTGRSGLPAVVFTSELDAARDASSEPSFADTVRSGASQTTGIWLDHQMWSADGALGIRWDVVPARWPAGFPDIAFAELLNRLNSIGAEHVRPLNELQQSYFVGQLSGGEGCQVHHCFDVETFDADRLRTAWLDLLAAHDVLRSWVGQDGALHVLDKAPSHWWIPVLDLTDDDQRQLAEDAVAHALPIGRGPQSRLLVVPGPAGSARVHCLIDLLPMDGRSIHLLLRELFARYAGEQFVTTPNTPATLMSEADANAHWRLRVAELLPGPKLARSQVRTRQRLSWHRDGWTARDTDAVLAAAFAEALAVEYPDGFSFPVVRWNRAGDERRPGEHTALSWFTRRPGEPATPSAFAELVKADATADAVSGLVALRAELRGRRAAGGLDLPIAYTGVLDLTDHPLPAGVTAGPWATSTPDVSLDSIAVREGGRLSLYWDVVTEDFPADLPRRLFDRYCALVGNQGIVEEFNDTAHPFDDSGPVHQLFETWARERPDAIAVRWSGGTLSYAELNARANRIARELLARGVGPGVPVAISVPRGPAMVAAVFGVLKSGGCYVPLEPGLPAERAATVLADADIDLVITTADRRGWPVPAGHAVDVDALPADAAANPPCTSTVHDLAYVIFTSGSTGKPKGVAVTHLPVLNLIDWCRRTHGFGPGDLGLCVTSLGFDLSVFDLLGLLGLGAAVYIADDEQRKDPELLVDVLLSEPVTFWNSAPTALNQLAPLLAGHAGEPGTSELRLVYLSGDYTPLPLPDQVRAVFGNAQLVSLGGATEATVWSNHFPIGDVDPNWPSIPYGRPISNARYYILDDQLRPCPIGTIGELYIGGECLSEGYYRQPELTAQRFVTDPFRPAGEIMYRTGDLAVYYADGVIGFRGRVDNQVKIRGFRVELEEIEHRLRQHPSIADAVVLARPDPTGDTKLVAYCIATPGTGELPTKELRQHAAGALPDYMVPNVIVRVDGFPATDNGKLDRAALPWPVSGPSRPQPADLGAEVGAVFERLLGTAVDPSADLWDQGATSFTMVQAANALKSSHGVTVRVAVLLDDPTVNGIAAHLACQVEPAAEVDFFSAEDRANFKATRPNLRPAAPDTARIALAATDLVDRFRPGRATRRDFTGEPVDAADLGALLSLLGQDESGHRLYPSAGDIYAVQAYVLVRAGGVRGVAAGSYYYDPVRHELVAIAPGAALDRTAHFVYNRELHDQAGFGIYLFGERAAIEPLYDEESGRFLLVEAGYVGQLLMLGQATSDIGLCPIGTVAEPAVRAVFDVGATATYLHCLLGGHVVRERSDAALPVSAPIAVIGMAGRYPGADDVDAFWNQLRSGGCALTPAPGEPGVVGGFLSAQAFDSLTFGIAPAEADALDPQLRLLLTVVWECLDDAGHTPESLRREAGRVGVYLGAMWQDHQRVGQDRQREGNAATISATASDAAGRVSHVFGFTGPSIAVDAACSSSLAALHLALAGLRAGDCDAAIVAGVNLIGHPYHLDVLRDLNLLRDSGRGAAYDESAPGWSPGEGCGALLLRASGAGRDVEYAIVEASRIGHQGGGLRFGAPSSDELRDNLTALLADAGIAPAEIDYVECAAAGAVLADAAELGALHEVFGPRTLPIGTLKPNIGHLEAAAGIAQLTKAIRQLRDSTIAPTLLADTPRTVLDLTGFDVARQPTELPETQRPHRILVNAVGATGALGQVVVRAATPAPPSRPDTDAQLIVLSADTEPDLRIAAGTLAESLRTHPHRLDDIAFTLRTGRRVRRHRLALTCDSTEALAGLLARFAAGDSDHAVHVADVPVAGPLTRPGTTAEAEQAWLAGNAIDWSACDTGTARRVSLPSHQFHQTRQEPDELVDYLVTLVAETIGTSPDRVHPRRPLAEYGLSSVLVSAMLARINADIGPAPSTLFFDQPDLAGIAEQLRGSTPTPAQRQPEEQIDDIAIIGLAGRYPDATDLDQFWRNLAEGRDSIRSGPPQDRLVGESEPMWGSYLDGVTEFDPLLFGITPRDARLMDPQERLLLQTCWRLWENAGYAPRRLAEAGDAVGVFVGSMYNEYPLFGANGEQATGSALAGIANRVSYAFGLTGPSLTVDTMCSSSLTAIHLAAQAIRAGDCTVAVAGGVNLSLHPNKFRQQRQLGMDATDHHCRSFGAGGDGFVPGEGVGAVLLKPLSRAVADGDRIHGVIRASAVNHGGHSNGYLVPSVPAQADVLGAARDRANPPVTCVDYIEAHGTGTALGDPIEIEALRRAYGELNCPIGSVKSNIGHLEAAAGIAGLTKVLLQFAHGQLVPSLHADQLNPNIDWTSGPHVQRELAAWPRPEAGPRTAAISSFGAGGANAHLIVAEPPVPTRPSAPAHPLDRVFVLSARTAPELAEVASRLAEHLRAHPDLDLADLAFSLRAARIALPHRAAVLADDRTALGAALTAFADTGSAAGVLVGKAPSGVGGPHQRHTEPTEDPRRWVSGADLPSAPIRTVVDLPEYPSHPMRCWAIDEPPAGDVPLWSREWTELTDVARQPLTTADLVICLHTDNQRALADRVAHELRPATVLTTTPDRDLPADRPVTGWIDLTALDGAPDWPRVLQLLQQLLRQRPPGTLRVLQATSGLFGPDARRGAGAELAGFVRVLGAEFDRVHATVFDVEDPSQIAAGFPLRSRYSEIALRDGTLFAPSLVPIDASAAAPALDPDRTYLVSGGTRGLGALVAEHLVRLGARRLAVLGTRENQETLAGLRASGADVRCYYGPLTDTAELAAFVDGLGPVAGVVHCAGRGRDRPASLLSLDPTEIWAPKALGFDRLAALCPDVDFFLSFSSVSSAIPALSAGVADYSAANAYLDYAAGQRFLSVNWPIWRESAGAAKLTAQRVASISNIEGLRALDRLLGAAVSGPVLVGTLLGEPVDLLAANTVDLAANPVDADPGWLTELFARLLHLPPSELDPETTFADLGVESVLLAEIVVAIEEELGAAVNPALLLDHPTLRELAAVLPGRAAHEPSPIPEPTQVRSDRVAVIGIGCRLPGADGPDEFWALLRDGRCAVGDVPAGRWDVAALYHPDGGPGRTSSRWGAFVEDIEGFDADYFGVTPEQATDLDPAIRLTLESTEGALRDAGYSRAELAGRQVGVFVGARMSDYRRRLSAEERARTLGGDQNFIAAWLAQHLDLRGPNLVVDSACSSSLVSVQLAVRSLLDGESELAVAGGVDVLLDEAAYLDFSAAGALSPTGRCASFGRSADGFVPGEGAGVLLLKPLSAALRDGDRIHGVIDAVAVGNDGRTMGLTTPNPAAQADVVRRALRTAGREPREVGLLEAHGTATRIGDPMELRALDEVFADVPQRGFCALGSVKSNVGHLFSAAGIAGLIKALLAVRHAELPPTLFCEEPHPRCEFATSAFYPNQALRPWPEQPVRVAGVSAFGLGGTNAHAVVSSAPDHRPRREPLPPPEFRRIRLWRDRADRAVPAQATAISVPAGTASTLTLTFVPPAEDAP